MPGNVSKQYLHDIHYKAWKKGIKSLYYARSTSIQRADKVSHTATQAQEMIDLEKKNNISLTAATVVDDKNDKYDECLACQ